MRRAEIKNISRRLVPGPGSVVMVDQGDTEILYDGKGYSVSSPEEIAQGAPILPGIARPVTVIIDDI